MILGPHQKSQQRSQPKIPALRIFENTGLGFMLSGAARVAGRRAEPCNQQLHPTEIPDSQPCILGEYIGLVFLAGSSVGIFGVALI